MDGVWEGVVSALAILAAAGWIGAGAAWWSAVLWSKRARIAESDLERVRTWVSLVNESLRRAKERGLPSADVRQRETPQR